MVAIKKLFGPFPGPDNDRLALDYIENRYMPGSLEWNFIGVKSDHQVGHWVLAFDPLKLENKLYAYVKHPSKRDIVDRDMFIGKDQSNATITGSLVRILSDRLRPEDVALITKLKMAR